MTTARQIVYDAFKICGVLGIGQTLPAEDITFGYNFLQEMLSQWQRKRWLIWHLVDTAFTANGSTYYTVGSGGNYNITPRPDKIEKAYFVNLEVPAASLQSSYPLDLLQSYEDYADITLKNLSTWPTAAFYDSAYPTAKLYIWPVPTSGQYSVHILTKAILSQFTNLSDTLVIPPEYVPAMKWNLAKRLLYTYPRAQTDAVQLQGIMSMASDSLNVIRMANAQIGRLKAPRGLVRRGGNYNVYSDQGG